ncbi:MAG: HPP family protein [Pseudomonas sp.]|uniref:HPP family protein n=1 Tax=Pseudomonas abieticivorans TaxID=2931382 RepID=UPI0020BF67C7|nr:HPP family protein [Pseudomonas sp. PIA16]MDE1167298.1 HPP family protein [Pseudomonas sp.]
MKSLPPSLLRWLRSFVPGSLHVTRRESLRACVGALLGIALTSLITTWAVGLSSDLPLLIAPMGASAVLLFAAPASPLAQPWALIGGNLLAALVGVTCALWISDLVIAAAVAVGSTIALMLALRCLHPPSGAVALTAVLGGPSIHAAGYHFVFDPVLLNSLALLGCALVYHALTRHPYPHAHATPAVSATAQGRLTHQAVRQALEQVLEERDELLDIDTEDLQTIIEQTLARTDALMPKAA